MTNLATTQGGSCGSVCRWCRRDRAGRAWSVRPGLPLKDFWCHVNITHPCLAECCARRFSCPVVGTWSLFFIFPAPFFLVELFLARIRHERNQGQATGVR